MSRTGFSLSPLGRDSRRKPDRLKPVLLGGQQPVRVDAHDDVRNRSLDLAKPMRHTCGNNDYVARFDPAAHTALNCAAACARAIFQPDGYGVSRPRLRIDHGAPGHERPRAIRHMINFSYLEMHCSDARRRLRVGQGL